MARKRYTVEQIIAKLREAEIELAQGAKTPQACRKRGISENTYYRWRKEYGGLRVDQARRLKELERENGRLKKLLAETMLEVAVARSLPSCWAAAASRCRGSAWLDWPSNAQFVR